MVSMVLVPRELFAVLANGCGIQGQNYVVLIQENEMTAGFHYMN